MKKTQGKAAKAVKVTGKRGRPVVSNSPRQIRLAKMAERAEANGGVVKRGRAVNTTSARQIRLAERAKLEASGVTIKRGRKPKVEGKMKVVKTKKVKAEKVDPNLRYTIKDGVVTTISKFAKGIKYNTKAEAEAMLSQTEVEA